MHVAERVLQDGFHVYAVALPGAPGAPVMGGFTSAVAIKFHNIEVFRDEHVANALVWTSPWAALAVALCVGEVVAHELRESMNR